MVRWREAAPTGRRIGPYPIDLMPTFLDFWAKPARDFARGKLVIDIPEPKICDREMVFLEFNRFEVDHDGFGAFSHPLRNNGDELAINLTDKDELYDLENDPYEMGNLIDDDAYSAARDELHTEIIAWMNRTGSIPWASRINREWNGVLRAVGEARHDLGRKTASTRIPHSRRWRANRSSRISEAQAGSAAL